MCGERRVRLRPRRVRCSLAVLFRWPEDGVVRSEARACAVAVDGRHRLSVAVAVGWLVVWVSGIKY